MSTSTLLKNVCPLAYTSMRLIFGLSFDLGGVPEGSVISRLFIICGVVMMKITSSTNTKSRSGVMFSSVNELCWLREVFFIGSPIRFHPAHQIGSQFAAESL